MLKCIIWDSIIGEDKTLSIKIGQEAGGETADFILVRGVSSDVDRAVKEINTIVENAKNELIDNSYVRNRTFVLACFNSILSAVYGI